MKKGYEKYRGFEPINIPDRTWPNNTITKAPTWCSVDLRDGNQALVDPMNLQEKLEFFTTLVKIGFKEIEVGFPSASETEYEILQKTAHDANLSVSEYVRKVLNNQKVIVNYNLVADVPEIKKLLAEFGKIGSNLNQIAKYFNQGGILSQEMRGEINKRLRDLYEMKYKVMEMAGDFHGNTETYRK